MSEFANKPWLNADGSSKSEEEIKKISKFWGPETWDLFLADMELVEDPDTEILEEAANIEEFTPDECINYLYNLIEIESPRHPHIKMALDCCLKSLPRKQYQFIKLHFWEKMSEREIAETLSLHRSSIQKIKLRAFERIRNMILTGTLKAKARTLSKLTEELVEPHSKNFIKSSKMSQKVVQR